MHRGRFVWTSSPPLAGQRTPPPGPMRVCVCSSVLAGSGGLASRARFGAPHLFLWPVCLSALLGPLRAGVAPFVVLWLPPPPSFFFFFLLLRFPCARLVSLFLWFPAPGALGLGALFFFPPPPPACVFFCTFSLRAPVVSGFLWFPALGALGLGAVCCLFSWPPAPRLSVRSRLFCGSCLAVGCSLVVVAPPPPPFCVLLFFSQPLCAPFFFSFCFSLSLRAPVVSGSLWFPAPGALGLGAVCCLFRWPPAPRLSVRSCLFCGSCLAVACSLVVAAPPPPLLCLAAFLAAALCSVFFSRCAPPLYRAFSVFRRSVLFVLSASRFSALRALSPLLWFAPARWLLPAGCYPPPLLWLAVFLGAALCSVFFSLFFSFFSLHAPLSLAFCGFRPRVPWALAPGGVCFVGLPLLGSPCALASFVVPAWPLAAPWWLLPPPPPPLVSRFFSRCSFMLRFLLFFSVARPRCLRLSLVSNPEGPGPWRCVLFVLLASRSSAFRALLPLLWYLPGRWLLPGGCCPPSCVSLFFSLQLCTPFSSFFFRCAAPLSPAFSGFRPGGPWALALCAVCFVGLPLLGSPCAVASFVVPACLLAAPWWLLPPPPPFVSRCCSRCCFVLRFFFVARPRCLWLSLVSGPGCPGPWRCVLFVLLASRPSALRTLSPLLWFPPGLWLLPGGCCPPPPFCVSLFFALPLCAPFFFRCAPPLSLAFSGFRAPGALGLGAVCCLFCWPPASRLSVRSRLFCVSRLAVGCFLVFAAPPPFCVARFSSLLLVALFFFLSARRQLSPPAPAPPGACVEPCVVWCCRAALPFRVACCAVVPRLAVLWGAARCAVFVGVFVSVLCCAVGCCCVLCRVFRRAVRLGCYRCGLLPGFGPRCRVPWCAVCPWVRCCAALLRVVPPGVVLLRAVFFCCACLVSLPVVPCPLALPVALGPCALRRCFLRCSPALCALCCVSFVVARWCALLFAAVLRAVCVLGCRAVFSLSSPLCAVLCPVVLVHLRRAVRVVRAVAGAWGSGALLCVVLFPLVFCGAVLGLAARGRLLAVCFGVGVPVWPRGLVPCGWCSLLWCPASICRVLWCCAVSWCCAVVFCCRFAVLLVLPLPSCGLSCRAVLCCWLSELFCARWCCLCAVVPCPSLPARSKTLIMTLCYPAPVSASFSHVVEGSGLAVRRFVADPRSCLWWSCLILSWRACSETEGKSGEGGAEKGRGGTWRKKTKREGASSGA